MPLCKKGNDAVILNYSPNSLVTHLSKKFEKLIKKRPVSFLQKYDKISKNQFWFRENISAALNESKTCLYVFIDLSKAFHTVSNHLLFEDVGVRENVLKLFEN